MASPRKTSKIDVTWYVAKHNNAELLFVKTTLATLKAKVVKGQFVIAKDELEDKEESSTHFLVKKHIKDSDGNYLPYSKDYKLYDVHFIGGMKEDGKTNEYSTKALLGMLRLIEELEALHKQIKAQGTETPRKVVLAIDFNLGFSSEDVSIAYILNEYFKQSKYAETMKVYFNLWGSGSSGTSLLPDADKDELLLNIRKALGLPTAFILDKAMVFSGVLKTTDYLTNEKRIYKVREAIDSQTPATLPKRLEGISSDRTVGRRLSISTAEISSSLSAALLLDGPSLTLRKSPINIPRAIDTSFKSENKQNNNDAGPQTKDVNDKVGTPVDVPTPTAADLRM